MPARDARPADVRAAEKRLRKSVGWPACLRSREGLDLLQRAPVGHQKRDRIIWREAGARVIEHHFVWQSQLAKFLGVARAVFPTAGLQQRTLGIGRDHLKKYSGSASTAGGVGRKPSSV